MDDAAIISEWQAQFSKAAGADHRITRDEFIAMLGVRDRFLAGRLFSRFDKDGQGNIDSSEFIATLQRLTHASEDERLRFAFELHDLDDSGGIDKRELAEFMRANLRENRLQFSPEQIDQLVERFFQKTDTDQSGDISFDELRSTFAKYPDLVKSLAVSPLAWLKPRQPQAPAAAAPRPRIARTLSNRVAEAAVLICYALANAWLCFDAVTRYAAMGPLIQTARGAAAIVYLNGALIFIPMMRNLLTRLRRTWLGQVVPFDESVEFHKLCGHVMFIAALVHTAAHLVNRLGVLETKAGVTGLVLLAVFAAMWLTALPFVRKGGRFRLFYLAHLGYLAFVVLALLHGPRFWQWLALPVAGFLVERVWRLRRSSHEVRVISGRLLPSNVLALELERPKDFEYHAGGYLFLKCPRVSAFEWHPFTISSAPEDSTFSVHIRAVGSWTTALYKLIEQRPGEVTVRIDGPYGAPAEDIFSVKRAVLIGAGIGVTPFASVLRSIWLRKRAGDPKLGLNKVRFFWLSREQRSFEWFLHLLSDLETEPLFELNVFLTGSDNRNDLKSATLFIAMDMLHEETRVDLITGLQSKTQTGRPDWRAVFARIAHEDAGEPSTVFFCGPPGLARELKVLCREYGLEFRQEAF